MKPWSRRRKKRTMEYEKLVKLARHCSTKDACIKCPVGGCSGPTGLMSRLADAIEELSKRAEEWEALHDLWKAGCEGLQERMPRWIPVTEKYPDTNDDMLVTDGEDYAAGYYRPDANAWDSTNYGWLENRPEGYPCGIRTVTHWMPLPPLPEQRSEDDV